jgi:FtsH-binding integral membrane protein
MSEKHHIVPVWFFVGVLLLVYGVMIFISGLAEWSHPPGTVLAELHAPVWWGMLLIVLGSVYCLLFRPGRTTN